MRPGHKTKKVDTAERQHSANYSSQSLLRVNDISIADLEHRKLKLVLQLLNAANNPQVWTRPLLYGHVMATTSHDEAQLL